MNNLQLVDSLNGGYFAFTRNNYPIDEGIYSELYSCLFCTSSAEWLLDNAFNTISPNVSSRTGITLKNNASISETNLNIIKKAVEDDLKRFTNKNNNIEVEGIVIAYQKNSVLIVIQLIGFNDAFNFIYQKTEESLENINWKRF